jgi:hypothetical protein
MAGTFRRSVPAVAARPPTTPARHFPSLSSWPRSAASDGGRHPYRSSKTSVSVLPLPLRRIVPAAPAYAPVPPVIA